MKLFDIIIAGAGPAGLLLGKELSEKFSVLILEKNKIGTTNKNWLTYKDRWTKEKFSNSFIENEFSKWHVQLSYNKKINEMIIEDNFICFNEHKFLKYLSERVLKNKAVILENTPFRKFRRKNNQLIINDKFRAPLLIDCSGINSIILKKYNLIELPIYINCYAYIGEFDKVDNFNYQHFFKHDKKNYSVFGFTKIAPKLAQLMLFQYSNKKINLKTYRKLMSFAQKTFRIPKHKIIEMKVATYPTGVLKETCLDNIFLFGDAGFYSPSLNGMGFNEILRQYHKISKHISDCVKTNKVSGENLTLPKDIADDVNNLILRFFGMIINDVPIELSDQIFNVLKKLSKKDIQRIMRNDINDREVLKIIKQIIEETDISRLIKYIKKHHLKYIIRTLLELSEDIFTEEIHNLVFKHHKIRIHDMYT